MQKKWIKLALSCVILAGLLTSLSGCEDRVSSYVTNPRLSNLTHRERNLLRAIEVSGIQVIRQGMRFTFVIPTDCFFTKDSRQLKDHRQVVVDQLAVFVHDYMQYFTHPFVSIVGYTDTVWRAPARDRLSLHYAEIIADYFRQDGVDPDRIMVDGRGANDKIAANGYPMAASFNRRVEVTIDD